MIIVRQPEQKPRCTITYTRANRLQITVEVLKKEEDSGLCSPQTAFVRVDFLERSELTGWQALCVRHK